MKQNSWGRKAALVVCWVQGVYFVVTGLWPLADMGSFEAVTGKKHDLWLVRSVALLVVAIGMTLSTAAWRKRITAEIVLLGIASAVSLALIDIVYVLHQTIPVIYLADAAVEMTLIVGWAAVAIRRTLGASR